MKFTLGLIAILAIIGLGQAHQFPDFGKGPLHEDLQDILDLVPVEKIVEVVVDYLLYDKEFEKFLDDLGKTNVVKDMLVGFEAIPEVINLFNYLHKEGLNIYQMVNEVNKALKIKELVPPSSEAYSLMEKRTGGVRGFLIDIRKQFDSDAFISIYVDKLKVSTAFVNFINQLKSDNFQQIVNKVHKIKAFQFIVSSLKDKSVNLKIVADVMYLVFGINVPYESKTLIEELMDFIKLLPKNFLDIIIKYINEDEKVQKAVLFMFDTKFHDLLRALEATKEFQTLVIYIEKTGFPMIQSLQEMHRAIGMEKYVPPKIEILVRSLIETQKIGDGMQGMLKDLYDILPLDKIDALYAKKMRNSKVFVDFITKLTSKEMLKILKDLIAHKTYKEFITKTKEQGLDIEGSQILNIRIFGLKVSKI